MTADKAMKRVNKITEQVVGQTEVEETYPCHFSNFNLLKLSTSFFQKVDASFTFQSLVFQIDD